MQAIPGSKYTMTELLSQAFDTIHEQILLMFKEVFEASLETARDEIICSKRYKRNSPYKRWGYTKRKWIQTPIGTIANVWIPRIRNKYCEIGLLKDRFIHRSKEIEEIILEGFLWGMSSRKLRLWAKRVFGNTMSHSGICAIKEQIRTRVQDYRMSAITSDIKILVVDGLYGTYRKRGQAVLLIALGIDSNGKVQLLDWLGCDEESKSNWRRMFQNLKDRGLKEIELLVSDGAEGLLDTARQVWTKPFSHQLCLWHLQRNVIKYLKNKSFSHRNHIVRDYWEIFAGLDVKEAEIRLARFIEKWQDETAAINCILKNKDKLFCYYQYPVAWRHRLRTTNLAEGFFSHLRTFLRRFPGWVDEDHINFLLGLYLLGINAFHYNDKNFYSQKVPASILTMNFNRIY